jgi:hypothetical protein
MIDSLEASANGNGRQAISTGLLDLPAVRKPLGTGRDYLSLSAIQLYYSCPVKFYFKTDVPRDVFRRRRQTTAWASSIVRG